MFRHVGEIMIFVLVGIPLKIEGVADLAFGTAGSKNVDGVTRLATQAARTLAGQYIR